MSQAKNNILKLDIVDGTIAHQVIAKYKAAKIVVRPAPDGTGIIAGGAVRAVLEISGIKNISAKIQGSNNKVNIVKSLFTALTGLKKRESKISIQAKPVPQEQVVKKQAKPAPQEQVVNKQVKPAPQEQVVNKEAKPAPAKEVTK